MTPSIPAGNRLRARWRAASIALLLMAATACERRANGPPDAEFLLAAGDSSYWVRSDGSTISMRGSPLVLARLDGHFLELYVVDQDQSFENAQFIGQRLFERDLLRGDSTEIFRDTLTTILADRYARQHPDERRLGDDEEPREEPKTSAATDVSVLGVHEPYLSIEYHVDTTGSSDDNWHTTRHIVIDLRNGRQMTLPEVVGDEEAKAVIARGRTLFREAVDSVRRDTRPVGRRAARAIEHFRFDPKSFSLTAPNGSLMVAFSAPGQGTGGEGFTLPMRPIAVREPAWWSTARGALPTSTQEREERWSRGGYTVRAQYDTASRPVRLTLMDSTGREFPIGNVSAPVHRIYWLDKPAIDKAVRAALSKAFDESALYDEDARTASAPAVIVR
jgi:hypothetical protein